MSDFGARIQALRLRRGMTQPQLAAALGKGLPWVKKLEGGDRQSDPRLSLLRDVARVLQVPLSELLDDEAADTQPAPADRIRAALLRPPLERGSCDVSINRQTAYGYDAFQMGRFGDLGDLLPGLVDAARAADAAAGTPATGRALADVCHLTAIALIKLDDGIGAWTAADMAMAAADALGDPVEIALAVQTLAYAATVIGRPEIGVAATQAVIDRTAGDLTRLGDVGWTALGLLFLKAAVAAAGVADGGMTREMIEAGRRAGEHVPADANIRRTGFNATNVLLYQASVLGDLGEYGTALEMATRIHPAAFAALPRERRLHSLLETARSAEGDRRPDIALRLVLQAERESPQTVRSLPQAQAVIAALLAGPRPIDDRGLHALAGRAGVAG